jgi:exopolysaccharide biosynthesis polyprenyl glycosylphosphotransferase
MPRRQRDLIIQFNQLSDAVLIALVYWVSHAFREQLAYLSPFQLLGHTFEFSLIAPFRYYKWLYLIILPLYPFLLDVNGFYNRPQRIRRRQTLWILTKSVAICALIVIATLYFFGLMALSRGVIILFSAASVVALLAKDLIFQAYMRLHARRGKYAREVILVGSQDRNDEFEKLIDEHPEWTFSVIAKLNPDTESLQKLPAMLHSNPVSCVIFNVTQTYFSEVEKAILACETEGVEAWLVADFVRTSIARATIDDFHGKPLLVFRTTPEVSWQLVCKRLIDVAGAAAGLLILGPLVMIPAAVIIKLTSPGPILFRQKRNGLHGRQFTMLKFRSMVSNAEMLRAELEMFNEMTGPVFKIREDPRITPFGRLMRKTSLDELPQLWNVLKGEMSLVGPRPPIPTEVQRYDPWQRRRLSMKPGLTCLWQISGRNKIGFEQWMKLDLQYIDNWSLWLDLKILARTIPVVLAGLGAR